MSWLNRTEHVNLFGAVDIMNDTFPGKLSDWFCDQIHYQISVWVYRRKYNTKEIRAKSLKNFNVRLRMDTEQDGNQHGFMKDLLVINFFKKRKHKSEWT